MGDYPEISSLGPTVTDADISHAALLAVLHRYDTGQDTAAKALESLQMLGLVPTTPEERCKPLSTRQRRQAARRAERQKGAA